MTETTLYDRLGGREGIRAVVDEFYDRLVADEKLGPFFETADLESLQRTQTDFLCEAAGGPETYDAAPVREAHLHVPLTPAHVERAVGILEESLDEFDVPDEDARTVVEAVAKYEAELLARPDGDGGGDENGARSEGGTGAR
ncbi:truncated hemoglobin [Natronomonas sp. LN261]|uniref:truncated hemoglobin n=1 Tax=Natronomonas sp. LN261 TaxID=2750669 RepID=UPI0015EF65D2|nr:group 1 truncated hemoglobin [Natronomonas sp. LN261]